MCLEIDLHQVMKFVCCVHVQNNVQYFHLNYILYSYVSYEENVLLNNLWIYFSVQICSCVTV